MSSQLKVLIYGQSPSFLSKVPTLIRDLRVECLIANDPAGGRALLNHHTCAALIVEVREYKSGGSHDLDFLRAAKSACPGLKVIVLRNEFADEDTLTQFIVENRNVVLIREEKSEAVLSEFLEQVVGADRATEPSDFSTQTLSPIEEHIAGVTLTSHYQPIVTLATQEIHAYEALARCEGGGLLNNPGVLFEYAANKTMFAAIDYACTEAALRNSQSLFDDKMLFLNVQPRSLSEVDFPEILEYKALTYGRDPSTICVELTEQQGLNNSFFLETALIQFRNRGFKIAVDDFGEGNANFELLLHVNPDVVKVTGKIIYELQRHPAAKKILKSLTVLCQDLGIDTVAEFIETQEQLEILTDLGVTYGQGWHLGRPTSPEALASNNENSEQKTNEFGLSVR